MTSKKLISAFWAISILVGCNTGEVPNTTGKLPTAAPIPSATPKPAAQVRDFESIRNAGKSTDDSTSSSSSSSSSSSDDDDEDLEVASVKLIKRSTAVEDKEFILAVKNESSESPVEDIKVRWGDGKSTPLKEIVKRNTHEFTHTYTRAGSYEIVFEGVSQGEDVEESLRITVYETKAPEIEIELVTTPPIEKGETHKFEVFVRQEDDEKSELKCRPKDGADSTTYNGVESGDSRFFTASYGSDDLGSNKISCTAKSGGVTTELEYDYDVVGLNKPDSVDNFQVSNGSSGAVEIEWAKLTEDLTHYLIERRRTDDGSNRLKKIEVDKDETSYTDKDVVPGRRYEYTIRAVNKADGFEELGRESDEETITVSGIHVFDFNFFNEDEEENTDTLRVTRHDADDEIVSWKVFMKRDPQKDWELQTFMVAGKSVSKIPVEHETVDIIDLEPDTEYWAYVQACTEVACSEEPNDEDGGVIDTRGELDVAIDDEVVKTARTAPRKFPPQPGAINRLEQNSDDPAHSIEAYISVEGNVDQYRLHYWPCSNSSVKQSINFTPAITNQNSIQKVVTYSLLAATEYCFQTSAYDSESGESVDRSATMKMTTSQEFGTSGSSSGSSSSGSSSGSSSSGSTSTGGSTSGSSTTSGSGLKMEYNTSIQQVSVYLKVTDGQIKYGLTQTASANSSFTVWRAGGGEVEAVETRSGDYLIVRFSVPRNTRFNFHAGSAWGKITDWGTYDFNSDTYSPLFGSQLLNSLSVVEDPGQAYALQFKTP